MVNVRPTGPGGTISHKGEFPPYPTFEPTLVEECCRSGDVMPIVFEWYKYVGMVTNTTASITPDSPACRSVSSVEFAVLIGLLNRITRLQLATLRLGHGGKHGESVKLLGRCTNETAVKARWLCEAELPDRFERYLAEGLKRDLELKDEIERNIQQRGGDTLEIERRMLASIGRCVTSSGLTEKQIHAACRLPDLRSMYTAIGREPLYLVNQGLGSHEIHGTWTDLMFHYLEPDETGGLALRDHRSRPDERQFVMSSILILEALSSFVTYIMNAQASDIVADFTAFFSEVRDKILEANRLGYGSDFDVVGDE